MILTKPTEAAAQELADRCHAWLFANDTAYAASVAAGQTTAWAIPTQAESADAWTVPVTERVLGALTDAERAELPLPAEAEVMEGRT